MVWRVQSSSGMASRRILVADDEALFRSSAAESLRARFRGAEVLEAEDGAAALAVLERVPVDVLVTDLQMPNLGGLEVLARISSRRMPVQIVVVSAHMTDPMRDALDDLGALVWMDKPIDLDALHRAVERMLAIPRAHVSGVTLAGFVQLLEVEHQTCAVRVLSPDGVGTLVFEAGALVDAWTVDAEGDGAAMAILGFRDCTIDVIGMLRTDVQRVTKPLSFLLLDSARRADESRGSLPDAQEVDSPDGGWGMEPPSSPSLKTRRGDDAGKWEMLSVGGPTTPSPTGGAEAQTKRKPTEETMANISQSLRAAMETEGAVGAALVDYQTGMTLGTAGGGKDLDLEVAAAGNTEVVRAKMRVMQALNLNDSIDDILITLEKQYHIIRPLKKGSSSLFLYVVIDRKRGNLGLARHQLGKVEAELSV
jgi:CheY-like chemotaxis protein